VRALVTNDDGIHSPGLHHLARVALDAGLEVVVAAPMTENSGASASLVATRTDGQMNLHEIDVPGVATRCLGVEATPAYLTWAALRGAFGVMPDLVLSGINKGPNTGHAVLHSGTVGAALTASAHGVAALAVSMASREPDHWDTASWVAQRAVTWLRATPRGPIVLNVNVPDLPMAELTGIVQAPLASFGAVQADIAELGEGFLILTFSEVDVHQEPESDAALQAGGWATVTALRGPTADSGFSLDGLAEPASGLR
jgi:5'-nucleotidase